VSVRGGPDTRVYLSGVKGVVKANL
jgi:hypothetical protein